MTYNLNDSETLKVCYITMIVTVTSVSQFVAVFYSVLQCTAVCCSALTPRTGPVPETTV